MRIPNKSCISLATAGLMGDTYIKIESPTTGPLTFIDPESTEVIEGYTAAGLAQLQESAAEISVEAKQALIDIRGAIQDIRNSVAGLDRSFNKVETGLLSDENLANIRTTLADLKATGDNLKTASGKIDNVLEEGKAPSRRQNQLSPKPVRRRPRPRMSSPRQNPPLMTSVPRSKASTPRWTKSPKATGWPPH
ncbi:MAG: hypothetical protein R3F31_04315 [Verrucomicrobiales bacterium]